METKVHRQSDGGRRARSAVAQTRAADAGMAVTRIFVIFCRNPGRLRPSRNWARRWQAKVRH